MSEFMEFRLNFDVLIFEALTKKIAKRANGGSLNKALKTMIIEWSAIEDAGNTSKIWQESTINRQKQPDPETDLSAALDDIEAAFGE